MLFELTLNAGVNFDGQPGTGEIDFPTFAPVTGPNNDNDRIMVLTFAMAIGQASGNSRMRDVYVVFAENLADATTSGNGYMFHASSDVHEFVVTENVLLLPNWKGFVFGAEASGTFVKSFQLDHVRVDLTNLRGMRVGGASGVS